MTTWFHSTILATSLVATVAVGVAGAAIYTAQDPVVGPKADRLPIATAQELLAAPKADRLPIAVDNQTEYMTLETRSDGFSILTRVPIQTIASN